MLRLLKLIFGLFVRSFRARRALLLENLGLRQQLAVLARRRPQPRFWNGDRFLWIVLHRLWSGWRKALILVQPDTVVRWHRAGFRLYWKWISRASECGGRRPTSKEIRELIFQMVAENPTWGAPRIHGELKMLGFEISERTVLRWMQRTPRQPTERNYGRPSWPTIARPSPQWTSSPCRR